MELLVVSFVAGILTVAAPCVLPLLPVIIGRSVIDSDDDPKNNWVQAVVIICSLGVSIIVFTLALKATTALLSVPQIFWQSLSATIIGLFGFHLVKPTAWERFSAKLNLSGRSNSLFASGRSRVGLTGDILVGFSLGPVFNSCSPTYLFIVALILGGSFLQGVGYLIAYTLGLMITLFLIALLGQDIVKRLGWLAKPESIFKKVVGITLIFVALAILFGLEKDLQTFIIDQGLYAPISDIEVRLRD